MALHGYARVSSEEQSLDIQIAALKAAGCHIIRSEKRSGTKLDGRDELKIIMEYAQPGDTVVVTRLDRLARSSQDLAALSAEFERRQINLKALEQPIDTTTAEGRMFFTIVGAFAQFETEIRRARQREGIIAAKAKGTKYRGRKPVNTAPILALVAEGVRPTDIAKRLKVGRTTVYRAMGAL